jgi:hypothetical protein
MWRFNIPPGWAPPRLPQAAFHEFAAALRHASACKNCLVRRQGRCPGLEFCADCAWKEGTSREQD